MASIIGAETKTETKVSMADSLPSREEILAERKKMTERKNEEEKLYWEYAHRACEAFKEELYRCIISAIEHLKHSIKTKVWVDRKFIEKGYLPGGRKGFTDGIKGQFLLRGWQFTDGSRRCPFDEVVEEVAKRGYVLKNESDIGKSKEFFISLAIAE